MPARKAKIDLSYRPRLADLRPLIAPNPTLLEARAATPRVTSANDLKDRHGYAEDFLGSFIVPWPTVVEALASDVQTLESGDQRLDYTHFSITMSRSKRLALYVGVNIDGGQHVDIVRSNDTWAYDGRLPIDAQVGEALYANNGLDRGHLVRRQDPNWGDVAQTANLDTFHFTNCSPQMSGFNQKTWLELEDYILDNTQRWKARATVFTGPVYADDDRMYRGVQIPKAFWKVVAYLSDDGKPSASAYMIDQTRELGQLDLVFGQLRTYQRSVAQIERLTGIRFANLADYDGFSNEERATGTRIEALIQGPEDIRL
ncbi:DNA/RNA non-specific endonuclease [Pseudomonas sp. BCA14]|uniref:DNA/RNA non-specific endonuclease n=1 Tax=unclassified Pseudomonas TaxID=196821 RepID=UPI00106E8C7C|nr:MULTISPECIES: DNA/RNA non-specific endonuclease [unclassified Pseudomonas]TFF13474.1 DNA/RNA non-specific endonuclease [Pseudomonas sp. JMN1]TFF15842.1 DNA/RNA non-specific endonuclease [Pseudomonas sp. BCA17]TFF29777.1 DNA/RNA non-specific endonuclease [Pseudomonas sp. BCA13]TFF30620.1 DNA/RNA non-specific endonuclease [Pseudomonas sp. BCA14]